MSTDGGNTFPTVSTLDSEVPPNPQLLYLEPKSIGTTETISGPFLQGPVPAVAPNGDVYVAWLYASDGNGSSGAIRIARGTPLSSSPYITFDNTITAANITAAFKYNVGAHRVTSFPTIAVDQNTGYIYIAYTQIDTGNNLNVYFTRSTDNGFSWDPPKNVVEPTYASNLQFFPWITVDQSGKIPLVFCDDRNDPDPGDNSPIIDIFLIESLDKGVSFSTANIRVTGQSFNATDAIFTTDYQGIASITGSAFPIWSQFKSVPKNTEVYSARASLSPTSNQANATAHNNSRRLVKSGSNYHLVYTSNGEIYHTSTADGTTWSAYHRLSNGNGGNNFPSITEYGGKLYVVWQHQRTNSTTYDIYFATSQDGGATWPTTYIMATTQFSSPTDPLPVIQASVATHFSLMVVFHDGNKVWEGLTACRTTNSNPTGAGAWTKEHVPGTGSSDFWPALAGTRHYWGGSTNFGLAYANTARAIYYTYYQPTASGWNATPTNLSSIVPGTATHQTPSLTGIPSSTSLHVAWYRLEGDGSSNFDHTIIHRESSGFDSWPNEYTQTYYEQQHRPSISAVGVNDVYLVFQTISPIYSNSYVYQQHYDGSLWSAPSSGVLGQYPSISTGSTQARYVWTSQSGPPFTVKLNSQTLSKQGSDQPYYTRAINWMDSSGSYLQIHVTDMTVLTSSGAKQSLSFEPASLDTVNFTPANSWDYLTSSASIFPADADSLVVGFNLSGSSLHKVGAAAGGNPKVALEFNNAKNQTLLVIPGPSFAASGNIPKTSYQFTTGLNALNAILGKTEVKTEVKVIGLNPKPGTFASLGHIYDFTKQAAKGGLARSNDESRINGFESSFLLLDNYPNPFNPATTIKYQIPQPSHVTIKIYNLLGEEIRTLVDEKQPSGSHYVHWDGKDNLGQKVASGIYVYQLRAGAHSIAKKLTLLK